MQLKDIFVKTQQFHCNNRKKAIFQHVSCYHRAKLTEVSVFYNHSLALFNIIPVSLDTCFLICSYAPLCPTWLSVCQTETKRALLHLSLKSCETDKKHVWEWAESWEEPSPAHICKGFTASPLFLISQQQLSPCWGLVISAGKEGELLIRATCGMAERQQWDRKEERKGD